MDMEADASKVSGPTETVAIEDRRDELLDMVRKGILSPTDAEKIAAKENLGSFAKVPSADKFRVDEAAYWSIEQAVAWLIWRTTDAVRRFHDPCRRETIVWRDLFLPSGTGELEPRGFELEPRGEASLDEIKIFAASGIDSPGCSFDNAMAQLLGYLESGKVVASAVHVPDARGVDIQPSEWQTLHMLDTENGPVSLGVSLFAVATYRRIVIPRPALLELVADAEIQAARAIQVDKAAAVDTTPSVSIADRIRAAGGVPKLGPVQKKIWLIIQDLGGEAALPVRRVEYIEAIQKCASRAAPAVRSIDRFFAKFRDAG